VARKPRVEFEGAFYHVIVRGNQRQNIFRDDRDRAAYLEKVERYRALHGFRLYAYVLMSNHVHLLLETSRAPLSRIMQAIQFTYTQSYNRRHRTVGHLFQGRYKAILCDRDAYLLELVRYIHLNPARLRQPQDFRKYRWSSHQAYLGKKSPAGIETALMLKQLGNGPVQARRAYAAFIEAGIGIGHRESYYDTIDQRFLGDEDFIETVEKRAARAEIRPRGARIAFGSLVEAIASEHGASAKALVQRGRERGWTRARAMLVYLGREWSGLSAKEIGRKLQRDPSRVSRLYAFYARQRDLKMEAQIGRSFDK
jgi:REP element-mobilizing transposase RayT